ncbi:MAG TPA: DUF5060 domain-containing protein [Thermoanaerobaculia bacterium]|nr:DUF5060 domain-containing protein [Thermoanaerobaculia bacterium]
MSRHNRFIARSALITLVLMVCARGAFAQITLPPCSGTLLRFSVCEIVLTSSTSYSNGYLQASVTATFTQSGGVTKTVNGFWDGGGVFKIRFNASNAGTLTYSTSSSDRSLNGKSGSFTVSSTLGTRGFVRRNSTNAEKLVFDNGTRYFMWGQTYYQIITNARAGGDWQQSVDNSSGYNMNKVRMLLSPFDNSTQPFTDSAHNSLNLPHWQKFDEVVNYLNQKPMIADVILLSTNPVSYAPDPAMDQKYVRYALARLAAFPNVIWCLTNEWQLSPYSDTSSGRMYWNTLGGIVQNEDPWGSQGGNQRALSIHQKTDPLFEFFGSAWPAHAILQFGTHQPSPVLHPLPDDWGNFSIFNNLGHGIPVVNDEYLYLCDNHCPPGQVFSKEAHRQAIWGIATAGGYGSAGDLRRDQTNQEPTISAHWKDEPEYGDIARLVDFFVNHVNTWWRMTSQNPLVTSGSRVYVLADSGTRYVVYAAAGGTFTLNLPAPSGASSYRVFLYDPTTGSESQLSNVGGGSRTFTMPTQPHSAPDTGNDWVLRIEV